MRTIVVLLVLAVVAGAAAAGAAWWEERYFASAGPASSEAIVVVKPGGSLKSIAETLAGAGVVKNSLLFRAGVLRRGKSSALKAGEYAVPAHASERDVMEMLVQRKVIQHHITIAEGLTSDSIVAIVNADPVLAGPAFVAPEGSLLPETYMFERGTMRAELLARMHQAQDALRDELWPKRKEQLPIASWEDALNLASIVEKETALPEERPRIAAVFINRLKNGMRLESDPTIIYGLTKGVPLGHPLRQSELATPNPYSTYQIGGLPPTPISSPGRDAIAAVLNPPDTQELFFVANGKGGHAFAKTSAEHRKNVAAWRKIEREQAASAPAGAHSPNLR
jgi:UPF0755 protein